MGLCCFRFIWVRFSFVCPSFVYVVERQILRRQAKEFALRLERPPLTAVWWEAMMATAATEGAAGCRRRSIIPY